MRLVNEYPYNEKWDKKLNWLMDNSVEMCASKHTITFKVITSDTKTTFLGTGLFPKYTTTYATYEVWTSSKDTYYGRLFRYNDKAISETIQYSPGDTTMERLFELEKNLLSESMYD